MSLVDTPITRAEHEEFRRRMEEEHRRQDARIGEIEDDLKSLSTLTTSVEKLATHMESMLREQEKQGQRLEVLEERDGSKWRSVTSYVVVTVIGLILGFVFKSLGL